MGSSISTIAGWAEVTGAAAKYLPEPATAGIGLFNDAMQFVKTLSDGEVGGVPTSSLGDYAELIQMQIEVQKEMQTTNFVSNIERSKHESKMGPIRNIRLG